MGRLVLAMLSVIVSNSAAAEWFIAGENSTQGATIYIDPASISWSDNQAKLWRLDDFKTAQATASGTYLSSKSQSEYYCKEDEGKIRLLSSIEYSGNMASGEIVHSEDTPGDWLPVKPGSMDEALWKTACRLGRGLRPY
jgi:Surface-adhesin protein E